MTVVANSGSPTNSSSQAFSIVVKNVLPIVNLGENISLDQGGVLDRTGRFADPGQGTWTGTVDYGDGSSPSSLTLQADKTFTLNHRFANGGDFSVTVQLTDALGGTGSTSFSVHVTTPLVVVQSSALVMGKKRVITGLSLTLSGMVDSATAVNVKNYRLVSLGRDKVYGGRGSAVTLFRSAIYDPKTRTVTLIPRGKLTLAKTLQLQASGLKDSEGRLLDGTRSGKPGATFVALVSKRGVSF